MLAVAERRVARLGRIHLPGRVPTKADAQGTNPSNLPVRRIVLDHASVEAAQQHSVGISTSHNHSDTLGYAVPREEITNKYTFWLRTQPKGATIALGHDGS